MVTPMAVRFANLFMKKIECELLYSFEKGYNIRPLFWLRFIDDIFFIWSGDESSLKCFLDFGNSYSVKNKRQSSIRFTTSYSKSDVVFLYTKVKIINDNICTSLYSKALDTHTYLQY